VETIPQFNQLKKKVLFIHHANIDGGAQISLLGLILGLNERNYDCCVCSGQNDPEVVKYYQSHGLNAFGANIPRFPPTMLGFYDLKNLRVWRDLFTWLRGYKISKKTLCALLREIRPDVVHFNSLTLAPYCIVPFKLGIPCVVHVREPVLYSIFGFCRAWLRRYLNRYADKVICICEDNRKRLHLMEGKGIVIYNPVDFKKFNYKIDQCEARKALNIPLDAKAILYAGGYDAEIKGLHPFLLAMSKLVKKETHLACLMPSFHFPPDPLKRQWTIKRRIGKVLGIYRKSDSLFSMTRRNDLFQHVIAVPFTRKMEQWIAAADVVCVPHIKPHFSRTVMEAGAMKKPVVASRIGGVEEVVKDGETGLLVPSGDVQGLAVATEHLLNNPTLRKRLGENGFAQALELFDANKHIQSVERIYETFVTVSRHKRG